MQPQRDDAGEAEFVAVAAVQPVHLFPLDSREPVEPEPSLLARRVQRQRVPASELRMRAHQLQLFFVGADGIEHRAVQLLDGMKRAPVPRALGDPQRMLEHAAQPRNELDFSERVHVLERHVP